MGVDYVNGADHPLLVAMCENCTEADCPDGICMAWKHKYREIYGLKPMQTPRGQKHVYVKKTREERFKRVLYEVNGERHTIAEWARIKGLRYSTVYNRIYLAREDMATALNDALPRGKRLGTGQTYTANGKTLTLRQWAEELGVSVNTLQARVNRDWPVSRIFGQAIVKRRRRAQRNE